MMHCLLNFVILINWVLCDGEKKQKQNTSLLPRLVKAAWRFLEDMQTPKWCTASWILWYSYIGSCVMEKINKSKLPACCLTSSRQLDAFLGAYKHFSEMYAFEYGDILVLCVLCEGKKYKSRIWTCCFISPRQPDAFLRLCRNLSEVFCFESDDSGW